MELDEFLKAASQAIKDAAGNKEYNFDYELECILQYIIPKLSQNDIEKALEEYKATYTR